MIITYMQHYLFFYFFILCVFSCVKAVAFGRFPVASYAVYTVCTCKKRKHSTFIKRRTRPEGTSEAELSNGSLKEKRVTVGKTLMLKGARQKANTYWSIKNREERLWFCIWKWKTLNLRHWGTGKYSKWSWRRCGSFFWHNLLVLKKVKIDRRG